MLVLEKRRTLVLELGDGPLDGELVARLHLVHVLGHLSRVIALDEERELAREVRGGNGGVRADDGLSLVVYESILGFWRGLHDDAGGDGEERRSVRRELEDEPRTCRSILAIRESGALRDVLGRVVVVGLDLLELKVYKVLGVERALVGNLGLDGCSGCAGPFEEYVARETSDT